MTMRLIVSSRVRLTSDPLAHGETRNQHQLI